VSSVSCSKPSSANSAARWQRTSRTSASSKSGNHSLELHSLNWKYSIFFPARCRTLLSHHGRPQLLQTPFQSLDYNSPTDSFTYTVQLFCTISIIQWHQQTCSSKLHHRYCERCNTRNSSWIL
jgi:hypothetical protein